MGMSSSDPVGITFHNSAERLNWLSADHATSERVGAWVDWSTRRSEYQACTMAGRSNCRKPGIEPLYLDRPKEETGQGLVFQ